MYRLTVTRPAALPDANLPVIALELEGFPEVDRELAQQPDGKVTLSCAFAKVEGPPVNIDARGVAQNWLDPANILDWSFALYRPGPYDIVLLTNIRKNASDWTQSFWPGGHQVEVSIGEHKVRGTVERQGEVIDPRSPNFPDVRSVLGTITLSRAGVQRLRLQALHVNPERKLGFRLREVQLVPRER